MKRMWIVCLCILFGGFISCGQSNTESGVWNAEKALYTNSTYNLSWQLFDDMEWVSRPVVSESTIFKVKNEETQTLVKITVEPGKSLEDGWDLLSYYNDPRFEQVLESSARQQGMQLESHQGMRSQICGIHAMKLKVVQSQYVEKISSNIYSVDYTYQFAHNGHLFTIGVTALYIMEKDMADFELIVEQLLAGFSIK